MLFLGLVTACLCGLLWLVARTVLWASLMPQLVLITKLSLLNLIDVLGASYLLNVDI